MAKELLNKMNISYRYIDIHSSQEAYNTFEWFTAIGVPYIGVNGHFASTMYRLERRLALSGYELDEDIIKKEQPETVSVVLKKDLEDLKSKPKYTAIAVANDTPYAYTWYRVWNRNSALEAKEDALRECEESRKKRNEEGKKRKINSKCRIYSIDGEIQPDSILRDVP
jgi:glutaredoxin